jgi:aspartyl-tRNA(Asn)/glutamyl-tRNA(Gln) amidotransferase subunit B
LGDYFERLAPRARQPKALANWILNNLRARLAAPATAGAPDTPAPDASPETTARPADSAAALAALKFPPEHLLELVALVEEGTLSSSAAQRVFYEMFDTGQAPRAIVERLGLAQVSDTAALEALCDQVLAAHPGPAADYRAGKTAALNFLKGQVMKLSRGKANPALAGEILERKLRS